MTNSKRPPASVEAVVISLPNAIDRRRQIEKNLSENAGIKWTFTDGLRSDSDKIDLDISIVEQMRHFGRPLSASEIGCFKSHMLAMRNFLASGTTRWLLVLEDDILMDPNFDLDELLLFIEARGINYIRLYAKRYKAAEVIGNLSGFRQVIRFWTDPYGAQAYLISARGAEMFNSYIDCIKLPIDDELGRFWRHTLDPYCVFPFPIIERSVPSYISNDRDGLQNKRDEYSLTRICTRCSEKLRKHYYNLRYRLLNFGLGRGRI